MNKLNKPKRALMLVNIFVIAGLLGSTGYLYAENKDLKNNQSLTTEEKNRLLIEEINLVYDLPDEEPVVAIVTNPDEFKSQYKAFDNAENGDYLLFFRKARLNVLYRQSEKRVVKTAEVLVPITIEIFGSEDAIAKAEKDLAEFGNQVTIVKTLKEGITQAFIYDIDEDQQAETESIANQLKIEQGSTLPASIVPGAQTEIVIAVSSNGAAQVSDTQNDGTEEVVPAETETTDSITE